MTVSTNVEKFWQELNRSACPRKKVDKLVQPSSVSALAQRVQPAADTPDHPSDHLQQLSISSRILSAGSHAAYEDLERILQRDVQGLKAPALAHRRQALRNLQACAA